MDDDQLKRTYGPKIRRILRNIASELRKARMNASRTFDMMDEEFRWDIAVYRSADTSGDPYCDVSITIAESKVRDGESEDGINFELNITENGGAIIGGFTPFNYTDDVWVSRNDHDSITERWETFRDGCEPQAIANLIMESLQRIPRRGVDTRDVTR